MSTLATAATMVTGLLWRLTGWRRLAQQLVSTARGGPEDAATAAAMTLTQAGDRAVPVVRDAIRAGATDLVTILVGIGSTAARRALDDLAGHGDPVVARAAAEGKVQLDRAAQHDS